MAGAVLGGLGAVVGIRAGTEEPRFTVVDRTGAVEIRRYGPRLAAEVEVDGPVERARQQGFEALAGYIFGANQGRQTIAMTAPVAQAPGPQAIAMTAPVAQEPATSGRWRIRFFMPARYTHETLPVPTEPGVRILTVPAATYAVLRFTGARDERTVDAKGAALNAAVAGSRWRVAGATSAWFYDPPWTLPFLRRNEVAVAVEAQDALPGRGQPGA